MCERERADDCIGSNVHSQTTCAILELTSLFVLYVRPTIVFPASPGGGGDTYKTSYNVAMEMLVYSLSDQSDCLVWCSYLPCNEVIHRD